MLLSFRPASAARFVLGCLALASSTCNASFLADQALNKVLQDASQVFGLVVSSNTTWTNSTRDTANWMRRYPDSTPIAHMNIPGNHESATWNFSTETRDSLAQNRGVGDPRIFRCQTRSLLDSLNDGIRFFDLRYAMDTTDTRLVFWHNAALMSELSSVDDVLFGFYSWLEAHKSETVILSLQYEGSTKSGASNNAAVQQLLFSSLTSPAARHYFLQTKDELGTLGSARGKLILFRRFDLDKLPAGAEAALPGLHFSPADWADDSADIALVYNKARNLTAYIEDYYEPDDVPTSAAASVNIAHKLDATTAHLSKAVTSSPDSLFITFASGQHIASDDPVYPSTMALGAGEAQTPLGGVNHQLVPSLKALKGKRVGIVVLDFYDQPSDLVQAILDL